MALCRLALWRAGRSQNLSQFRKLELISFAVYLLILKHWFVPAIQYTRTTSVTFKPFCCCISIRFGRIHTVLSQMSTDFGYASKNEFP